MHGETRRHGTHLQPGQGGVGQPGTPWQAGGRSDSKSKVQYSSAGGSDSGGLGGGGDSRISLSTPSAGPYRARFHRSGRFHQHNGRPRIRRYIASSAFSEAGRIAAAQYVVGREDGRDIAHDEAPVE